MHRRTMRLALIALWLAAAVGRAAAADVEASERAQRDRLSAERAAAQARYGQAVRECERGFVVTSCVDKAKAERRAALDRVAGEQAALDDAQRRRRAEERRRRIAHKQAQREAQQSAGAASTPQAPKMRLPSPPASGKRFEPRSAQEAAAAAAEASQRAAQARERRERASEHAQAVRKRNAERAARRPPAAALPPPSAPGSSAFR